MAHKIPRSMESLWKCVVDANLAMARCFRWSFNWKRSAAEPSKCLVSKHPLNCWSSNYVMIPSTNHNENCCEVVTETEVRMPFIPGSCQHQLWLAALPQPLRLWTAHGFVKESTQQKQPFHHFNRSPIIMFFIKCLTFALYKMHFGRQQGVNLNVSSDPKGLFLAGCVSKEAIKFSKSSGFPSYECVWRDSGPLSNKLRSRSLNLRHHHPPMFFQYFSTNSSTPSNPFPTVPPCWRVAPATPLANGTRTASETPYHKPVVRAPNLYMGVWIYPAPWPPCKSQVKTKYICELFATFYYCIPQNMSLIFDICKLESWDYVDKSPITHLKLDVEPKSWSMVSTLPQVPTGWCVNLIKGIVKATIEEYMSKRGSEQESNVTMIRFFQKLMLTPCNREIPSSLTAWVKDSGREILWPWIPRLKTANGTLSYARFPIEK